jgi:hypothetical protein
MAAGVGSIPSQHTAAVVSMCAMLPHIQSRMPQCRVQRVEVFIAR